MELIDKAKILKKKTTLYIPADSEETFSQDWEPSVVFVEDIKKAPTIDPVHAAGACYCRECMHEQKIEKNVSYCKILKINCIGWCSRGERRIK